MMRVLCDSCFWFALCNEDDSYHLSAVDYLELFESSKDEVKLIIPFPSLYETLRTAFCKREKAMQHFNRVIDAFGYFVFDDNYRESSYAKVKSSQNYQGRHFSLVDMIIRSIIEDNNVRKDALVTSNIHDFDDITSVYGVEILPLDDNQTFRNRHLNEIR